MKFLIIFAVCSFAGVWAFDLRRFEVKQRSVVLPVLEDRITNGQTASVGQFPYQVGLSLKHSNTFSSWCGGSLIANNWVLTAAHCTEGFQSVTVYLGATVRTSAEVKHTVSNSEFFIHPDWNSYTLKNDISLIKIPSTAYTTKIKAVKLPAIANSYSTYVGDKAIASGWGRTANVDYVVSNLQWARMEVIGNTACAKSYGTIVSSSNICVSTLGGVSTCQGDSGGPLVLDSSSVQVGLTSFGAAASCVQGYPAVFTRITSYLEWIQNHTGI